MDIQNMQFAAASLRLVLRGGRRPRLEGWGGPMLRDALLRSAPHHEARRVLRALTIFAFVLIVPAARAEDARVTIDNFTFNPPNVTVKAGTTVTWSNRDDIPHTVVSLQKFRSKALDSGDTFSFTFTTPGTYKYFCSLHPHMTGTIVVEAASSARE